MPDVSIKKVSDSAINYYPYEIFPNDLNPKGTVFGGTVMQVADRLAGVVAQRHSEKIAVTLLVDSMRFLAPARQGETLIFKAAVNRVWRSSMEVGVKVIAQDYRTNEERHVLSAYFTFVALDEGGKPTNVCELKPVNKEEIRRYTDAERRRKSRLAKERIRKGGKEKPSS